MLKKISSDWDLFFRFFPLFEISLYLLLSFFTYYLSFFFFILTLFFVFLRKKGKWLPPFLTAAGTFYCFLLFPQMPSSSSLKGAVLLKVVEKRTKSFFNKQIFTYKGTLTVLQTTEEDLYYNIPCIFTAKKADLIEGEYDYFLSSVSLQKIAPYCLKMKIEKESEIFPIKHRKSSAKARFIKKKKVEEHVNTYIQNPRVLKILTGLSIGYLDHKALQFEFSKVGISHLLAISGFHFSLLSLFLLYFLKPLSFRKTKYALLFVFLTFYVMYLGSSPSVLRAYVGVSLYILGILLDLRPKALNTLSFSFLLSFLIDPLSLLSVSFQLSYLATFALLAFYRPLENFLNPLTPKRALQEVLAFPFLDKCLYLFLDSSKKNLALGFSVSIATLPILLATFNQFPLLSLAYNLVIPFLLSFSMMLLLLAFLFSFAPFLCGSLHSFNTVYTDFILSLIEAPPKSLEFYLHGGPFTLLFSSLLFFLLLFYSVHIHVKTLTSLNSSLTEKRYLRENPYLL